MNKTYKTVWNRTTGAYVATSEVVKSRGAKVASVRGALVAASASLLSTLALAQAASAEECALPEQGCLASAVAEAPAPQTAGAGTQAAANAATPAELAAAISNASVFAGNAPEAAATQPAIFSSNRSGLLGLTAAPTPVTDYIAVSSNVVQGTRTSASNDLNTMAIGPTAAATGDNAMAVGGGSVAGSEWSTAVGSAAGALSPRSTAIGTLSTVGTYSDDSVAIGYNSRSAGLASTSIGSAASASAIRSMAIGYNTWVNAMATDSMAIGSNASTSASGSVALGHNTWVNAMATDSMAIGSNSSASASGSVALGANSIADRVDVVSVGTLAHGRQIAYVAAGTQPTDAVNVTQLSGVAKALGGGALINSSGAVVAPAYTIGGATYNDVGSALAAAVSASAAASVDSVRYDTSRRDTVTLGNGVLPVKVTNVADGELTIGSSEAVTGAQLYSTNQAVAQNTGDITAITNNVNNITNGKAGLIQQDQNSRDLKVGSGVDGGHVDFTGTSGLGARELLGVAAGTTTRSAVNLGQLSPVITSLGGGATVNTAGTVSGPRYHVQSGTQTTVGSALDSLDTGLTTLQSQITLGTVGLVTQDPNSHDILVGATTSGERINMASLGGNRVLVGVAPGAIKATSTEAVNGAQLYANTVGTAAALGGGSTVNADGTLKRPVYNIGGSTYSDVGSALAAAVTTSVQAGADAVQYDSTSHDSVTLGNGGAPVQLTNLRAANLAADSSDAVNGAQLFATNQAVAQNTGSITNLEQRVTDNTTNISNLDQRTTTIEGDVSNITNQITNGEIGLVQQDPVSRNLTVAKDTDGARVDFTGTGGARELTGIAAGTTDSSAVNLGQFRPAVAALGGGAQINADGSLTGPTYHMQGGTQTTVGDALGSLDNGLTTLQQNMATGGIGMVTQDPVSRVISVGATTDGDLINMAGTAGNRVVTGVAPGTVSSTSSDAVNGAQLHAQATSTAVALGGGAAVNPDGTVTAPSYNVGGTVVNNVGSAITNLDGRVTQNSNDIAGLQTTIGNLNGAVANAVQYDSSAHDRITLGGISANAPKVQLTNLQDGELSATSTDAVTGAQLWNTNQNVSSLSQMIQVVQNNQTTGTPFVSVNSSGNAAQAIGNNSVAIGGDSKASAPNSVAIGNGSVADQTNTVSVGASGSERRITNVAAGQAPTDAVNMQQFQGGMSDLARNAYTGTAQALALTAIPEVDANKNLAIGVGTAGYKGYQAVAVGLSARVTQSLKVKLGAGISSATTSVTAGAAYQW